MLRVTTVLDKVLGRRARVIDDVYPSAGLQKPFIVDWKTLPATQVLACTTRNASRSRRWGSATADRSRTARA